MSRKIQNENEELKEVKNLQLPESRCSPRDDPPKDSHILVFEQTEHNMCVDQWALEPCELFTPVSSLYAS